MDKLIECIIRLIKNQKVKIDKVEYGYYKIDNKNIKKNLNHFYCITKDKKDEVMKKLSKKELEKNIKIALNKGYKFDIKTKRNKLKILIDNGHYVLYRVVKKENPYIHLEKLIAYDDLEVVKRLINLIARSDK